MKNRLFALLVAALLGGLVTPGPAAACLPGRPVARVLRLVFPRAARLRVCGTRTYRTHGTYRASVYRPVCPPRCAGGRCPIAN